MKVKLGWYCLGLVCLVSGGLVHAESIVVGHHDLLPNTPDQPIEIFATGDDMVAGLSLYAMVGDGGPEIEYYGFVPGADGPEISDVDCVSGTIFDGEPVIVTNPDLKLEYPAPQVATRIADLGDAGPGYYVPVEGKIATLFIDTTGFWGGTWELQLAYYLRDLDGQYPPIPAVTDLVPGDEAIVTNGTITIVPEPGPLTLSVLAIFGLTLSHARRRGRAR